MIELFQTNGSSPPVDVHFENNGMISCSGRSAIPRRPWSMGTSPLMRRSSAARSSSSTATSVRSSAARSATGSWRSDGPLRQAHAARA